MGRRQKHLGVIFISHTLPHVFEIADRVSVMRRGKTVLTAPVAEVTTDDLIRAMTGVTQPPVTGDEG